MSKKNARKYYLSMKEWKCAGYPVVIGQTVSGA
ncbi:hypothetical protein PF003_g6815 [Phytophthora fragariae]|nr:hypothetical protein PF003_g6815 [Phytophthora fragariae]